MYSILGYYTEILIVKFLPITYILKTWRTVNYKAGYYAWIKLQKPPSPERSVLAYCAHYSVPLCCTRGRVWGQSRKPGQQIARRNSKSSLNSAYEEALSELPSPKQDLFFNQKILDLIANMFKDSKLKPKNHGYIQLDCSAYDVNGACTREWSSDCYQPTGTTDTYNGECSVCSYGRTTETKYLWVKRNYCSP